MITGIASLTVGWVVPLPFGIAAVILGHMGLSQVKKTGEPGRNFGIVYAHNDSMALGAAQAIEAAGLKPGKDIIIVSIDAMRAEVQAVADGRINCTVECNPLFGPKVYDTAAKILAGETVPKKSFNKDELIDATNAAQLLPARQD